MSTRRRATAPDIDRITRRIVRGFQPEKIILFGSHAWGTPGPDSDVDLLVVKAGRENPLNRMREVHALLTGVGCAVDVLVYTPEQMVRRTRIGDPFVEEIVEKGKVLYDARRRT